MELNFISGKQACHELRKGEQGCLAWVYGADGKNNLTAEELGERIDSRSALDDQQRKQLAALLEEFGDVVPKELPARLPPRRDVNHGIDLEPGAVPPSRSLRWMSCKGRSPRYWRRVSLSPANSLWSTSFLRKKGRWIPSFGM